MVSQIILGDSSLASINCGPKKKMTMISSGGSAAPPAVLPFIFTIDTQASGASDDSFQLPLIIDGTYNFEVDFGDGNQATITSWDDLDATHNYAAPGVYQITITGTCTRISFSDWPGNFAQVKLISVDQWGDIGVTDAYIAFSNCPNLATIATAFWPGVTSAYATFDNCSALSELPAGLFDDCTSCLDYSECFNACGNLTTLPAGLFANSPAQSFFRAFLSCNNLTSIPADTFAGCTAVNDMREVFGTSGLIEIPAGLLDDCTSISDVSGMFIGCATLTTVPANLFANAPLQYANECFRDCTSLTSIPATVFSGCSSLLELDYAFAYSGLLDVPAGLFDDCTALASVAGTFYATPMTDVPSGLFQNLAPTNLAYCFQGSSLNALTDAHLWNVTALTDATDMLTGTDIGSTDYDALLDGWAGQAVQSNVIFGAGNAQYTAGMGAGPRAILTGTYGWTITDGGVV